MSGNPRIALRMQAFAVAMNVKAAKLAPTDLEALRHHADLFPDARLDAGRDPLAEAVRGFCTRLEQAESREACIRAAAAMIDFLSTLNLPRPGHDRKDIHG